MFSNFKSFFEVYIYIGRRKMIKSQWILMITLPNMFKNLFRKVLEGISKFKGCNVVYIEYRVREKERGGDVETLIITWWVYYVVPESTPFHALVTIIYNLIRVLLVFHYTIHLEGTNTCFQNQPPPPLVIHIDNILVIKH